MINIETFVFNPFMENTYILHDRTYECIIVDAGCYEQPERDQVETFLRENELKPVRMVNTHCHVDHVLGVAFLKERYSIPFSIHPFEKRLLEATQIQGNFYGLNAGPPTEADDYLEGGDKIFFGDSELRALHVPGHSPGSLVLYSEKDSFLLAGDVLFRGSIGRSDLPGGDHETLVDSIREKLLDLDPATVVYPGHGPETTIGFERDNNPYLS